MILSLKNFYPRSPCGERHRFRSRLIPRNGISIHALLAESDGEIYMDGYKIVYISIHALLAESDLWVLRKVPLLGIISIHALLAESDLVQIIISGYARDFYPRSPCGERPLAPEENTTQKAISIHALLAESDSKSAQNSGALLRI